MKQLGRILKNQSQDSSLSRISIQGTLLISLVGGVLPAVVRADPSPAGAAAPLNLGGGTLQLERSWERLNQQLDSLDTLLGPAPALESSDDLITPELPASLMDANRPAQGPLLDENSRPDRPLDLPSSAKQTTPVQSVTLEQAVAIACCNCRIRRIIFYSRPKHECHKTSKFFCFDTFIYLSLNLRYKAFNIYIIFKIVSEL